MAQRELLKYCQICGCRFIAKKNNAKYCPDCRKEIQYQQNRNKSKANYESEKMMLVSPPTPHNHKIFNDLMRELKAYNEKHNTKLSYGQYVLLIEGRI